MSQAETNNLVDELLKKTEQGRVQDWNERLAAVARLAGVDVTRVAWSKAPRWVAIDIADLCRREERLTDLAKIVHELQ